MTGIARERDFLSGDHALTDVDQRAVFSQVVVLARGAIVMPDHHVIGVFAAGCAAATSAAAQLAA